MIALTFTGYWPSLEDINRRQHETPTQELKLRPRDNARTGAYRPCHCQPAADCGEAERVMFKWIVHVEIVTDELDRVHQMARECALAAVGAGSLPSPSARMAPIWGLDIPPRSPSHRSAHWRVADQQPSAPLTLPTPSRIAPCSSTASSTSSTRS